RLRPGGYLVSADLASDTASPTYQSLLEVWIRLMRETGSAPEQLEKLRVTYGRDVAVLPLEQVSSIIASGGFETPVLFLQTCLIHAWYAQRTPTVAWADEMSRRKPGALNAAGSAICRPRQGLPARTQSSALSSSF